MRVEQLRGEWVETVHEVHVAVVDSSGRLVARTGDPELVTFWRSAAKPFQALPLVEDGAAERFALTSEELALACASHSSEPGQVALARHHGWPTEFYTRLEHPVQQRCLAEVSRWTDVPVAAIKTAVDGCGVVCYGLPLRNMAMAYARLANAKVVVEAMLRHPDLIAGEGRPCTDMMRAHPGRVIVKVGAEGVYCALLPQEGLGVALKVSDGHAIASALAMAAVLEALGLRPRPASLTARPNVNTRGETVGELRVNGGLEQ